jgi:hypothetical protein
LHDFVGSRYQWVADSNAGSPGFKLGLETGGYPYRHYSWLSFHLPSQCRNQYNGYILPHRSQHDSKPNVIYAAKEVAVKKEKNNKFNQI